MISRTEAIILEASGGPSAPGNIETYLNAALTLDILKKKKPSVIPTKGFTDEAVNIFTKYGFSAISTVPDEVNVYW